MPLHLSSLGVSYTSFVMVIYWRNHPNVKKPCHSFAAMMEPLALANLICKMATVDTKVT